MTVVHCRVMFLRPNIWGKISSSAWQLSVLVYAISVQVFPELVTSDQINLLVMENKSGETGLQNENQQLEIRLLIRYITYVTSGGIQWENQLVSISYCAYKSLFCSWLIQSSERGTSRPLKGSFFYSFLETGWCRTLTLREAFSTGGYWCNFPLISTQLHAVTERDANCHTSTKLTRCLLFLFTVSSVHSSECLQKEKEELRVALEDALQKLQEQHQKDQTEVERRLQAFYQDEWGKVRLTYQEEVDKCKTLTQQQVCSDNTLQSIKP